MKTYSNVLEVDHASKTRDKQPIVRPFLKWAGGKTQLLNQLGSILPSHYNRYIEPFIGGGALYFFLKKVNSIISDSNEELILTYRAIQIDVERVICKLADQDVTEDSYYKLRETDPASLSIYDRAARFIFLNKTCYNGLYRVNKKGQFNVPFGKRAVVSYDINNLREVSNLLKRTQILCGDYLDILNVNAKKNDLIFLDPPYYPIGAYSDFKRYTKDQFYHEDHVKLRVEFDRLVNMGCFVVLTNSAHPTVLDMYRDYTILTFDTKRQISCKSTSRVSQDIIVLGNV